MLEVYHFIILLDEINKKKDLPVFFYEAPLFLSAKLKQYILKGLVSLAILLYKKNIAL